MTARAGRPWSDGSPYGAVVHDRGRGGTVIAHVGGTPCCGHLYEELGSYRAVAAIVGCDHKTVKAHVERGRQGAVVPRVIRRRATDPYRHLIRERAEQTQGRVRGRRLLKVLRVAGYGASLRTLQRALREEKRRWQRGQRRVYRPWQSAPGDFLIVDWGEVGRVGTAAGERKLLCFCAVLGWSRWR